MRELHSRKLLYGNRWGKGIDSGFGLESQPSRVPDISSVGFADLGTLGMVGGDVEMQELGSKSTRSVKDDSRDVCEASILP